MSFNLGFIGGGNMSTAIVQGIFKTNTHPPSKIWVSGPRLNNLKHWSDLGTNVTNKNGEVFCECDVIFLGVKPSMLTAAVSDCLKTLTTTASCKGVLFVSMLAGITIADLQKALKQLSKDVRVIRIMPNTPMTVGEGACLYTPDESVSDDQCQMVEKLLRSCGMCERVPEYLINSLGALTGCGPAFVYIIIEALADGAVKQGVPRDLALRFAAQMVAGSGKMVLQSGKHPGLLKDEVCSPGGSTICGVTALEEGKIRSTLINAVEASTLRNQQIGKK
ncbi:pyrroline-5-carboxylate reductase 3 [Leguminivora glycinivorella]|uniref:pyrroline-5-carboxylate reductase 3 n=1 Tax=Leguminivora glycinivorella TaxID=1035111 RepID=UPI002010A9C6|nr:pyrroline-5-carboxylate reductase 3 [Leguminivora glycinivorella]